MVSKRKENKEIKKINSEKIKSVPYCILLHHFLPNPKHFYINCDRWDICDSLRIKKNGGHQLINLEYRGIYETSTKHNYWLWRAQIPHCDHFKWITNFGNNVGNMCVYGSCVYVFWMWAFFSAGIMLTNDDMLWPAQLTYKLSPFSVMARENYSQCICIKYMSWLVYLVVSIDISIIHFIADNMG